MKLIMENWRKFVTLEEETDNEESETFAIMRKYGHEPTDDYKKLSGEAGLAAARKEPKARKDAMDAYHADRDAASDKSFADMMQQIAATGAIDKETAAALAAKDKANKEKLAQAQAELDAANAQGAAQFKKMMAQLQAQADKQVSQAFSQNPDVEKAAAQAQQIFQKELQKIEDTKQAILQKVGGGEEEQEYATDCAPGANYSGDQTGADGRSLPCPGPEAAARRKARATKG